MPKEIRNEETKTPLSFRITQLFENQKSTALITAKNIEIKIETNFFLRVFTEDELIATRNGIDIESHNKDTNPLFQQYICIYDYLFNMKKIFQVLYNYGYSSLSCENDLKEIFSNETFSISETAMKKYNNFINLAKLYGNKIPNNLKSSQTITIGNYCFSLPSKPPFMTLDNIRYFGHLISSARSGNDASFDELNRQINYLFPTIEYFINKEHLNQLNDDSLLASLEIFNEIFSINKRRKILPVFSKNDEIFNSLKNLQNRFLVTNIQILQVKYPVHTYHLIKPISDFFGFNFYQILWCNQSTNFNNFIIDLESSRNSFTNDIFLIVHPEFLNKNEENNFTDFVKSQISPFPDKNSPKIIVLTAIHNLISLSEHENENYLLSVSPNEVIKYHDATINYLVDTPFRVIYSDQSGDGKTNYIKNLCGKKNYVFIDDEEPDIKSYFNPQEEKIVLFSLNRQTFVDNVIFWDQLYCGYIFKIFLRPTLPPYIPKFDLNEKIIYYIEIPSSYKIHNHNESIGDCLIDFPIPLIEECFIKIDPSKQNCYDSSYIEKNELIVNNQKYTDFYRAAKFMHTFSLEENNKSDFPRFFSFIYSKIFRGETVPYISLRLFSYVESYIRKMIIRYGNNSFDDFHKSLFYTLVLYSSVFIYNLEPCVEGNPNNKKVVSFLCMICDNLLNNKNSNESKVTFYTNRQEKDFIPSLYQNVEIRKHLSNKKLNGIKILFIQNIDKNDQIDMFTRVASQISTDETFLMTVCLCKIADIFLTSTEERKYRIFIDEMTNLIYKKDEITNIFQFFYNLNNEGRLNKLKQLYQEKENNNNILWKHIDKIIYSLHRLQITDFKTFEELGYKIKEKVHRIFGDTNSKTIMNISISWSYLIRISSLLNRLYLNQPAILVGETGVGKTSFLKLIQSFINLESGDVKNEYIFHTQNVYDDFSHEQIQNILEENRNKIVFFDEFNTSSACSFILYTMLNSNRSIIAAMNPSIKTNEISKIFSPIGLPQHLIFHCDQKVLTSKAQIGQDYDIYHYKYFVYDVDINDIFIYCDPVKQSENEDDWLPDEEYQNIRHFVCSNFANSSVFFQTKEYYDGIVNQDQIVSFINIYLDCLKGTISFIRNMMNDRAAITFRDIQSSFDYLEIIFQKLIKNLSDNTLIEKVMLDSVLFTMILSFGLRFPKSFDIKGADFFAMKHIVKIINSLPNSNFTDYTSPSICNIFYTMNRSIQPCLSDNILFNKDYQQLYKITFNKENKNGYFTINSTKTIEKLISMQNVNLKISKNLLVDIILGVYEKDNNTIKILNSKEFTINDELVDLSSASFKLYIDQKLFENNIKYPNTYISYDIPNNLKLILKDFIYRNENNDDFGNRKNSELSIEFIDDMKVNLQYIFLESLNQVLKIEQSPEIIMEQFTKFIFWNEWNKLITGSQNWIIKSFLYNCFLIELCIETNNSCFIFGPPGTSKSYSIDQISKLYPNLFIFTYMCSQTSSENGLKSQFLDAATYIASKKGKAVICLEVMGHNNIRFKRTLKFLHFGLDNGINIKSNNKENVKVPCILISNYAMDFSNMNRATPIYAEPPELGEIIKAVNFSKKCYLDKTPDNCDFYKDFDKYYEKYSRFDDRDSFHCKTPERKGQAKMPEISEKSIFNILLPKNENQPIPLRPFYTVYQLLSADVKQNKIFFQIARELFVLSNFKGKSVVDLISNMKRIGQFTEDVAKHIRQPILKNSHEKRKLKKSNFLYNNIDLFYERLSNDTLSFKSLCIITTNYSYLEFIQELFDLSLDINISTLLSMKCNSQKARSKLPKIHTNNMKISPQFFISEDFKSSPDELCKYSLNQFTKLLLETNQNKKAIIVDNNPIIDSLLDLLNSNKFPNNESSNQVLLSYNGFPSLYNVNSNFYSIFVFEASTLFDNGNQIPKPFLDRLEYIYLDWSTIKYIVYYPVVTDYIKEKHVNATYQEYVNQIDSIITKILNYHEKSDNDLFVSQGNGSRRFNNQIIKNYSVDIPKFYYKDSNKLIRCNIGLHINPNNLYNYYQLNRNKSTFSFFGYQILDSYILKFSWSSGIKCVILTKSKIHDDFYRNQDIPSIIVEDNLILNANDFISYIDSEILKCKTKEIQIFVKCMNFNRLHDQHLKKLLESVTKKYYQLTIHCYILYFQCQFKDVFISTLRWPAFHMDDISVHHLFGNFTTITTEEIKDILYDLKYFDNSIIYKIIQETMKTLLLTLNNKNKYKILFEWLSNVLSSKPINLKESYIYSPCFELIKQFQISASIDCKQQQLPILSIHSQFLQQFQKQLIEFLHPFFILIKPFERNSYILNNCFSLNLSEIPFHAWKCLIQNINKSTIQEIKYTTKNKISFDLIILNNIKEMIENHCIIPFDKTTIDHQFFQSVKTFSPATEFFLFLSNNNMINLKSATQYIIDEMRKQNSEKAQIHILSHLLHNKKLLHEMTEEIFYSEPVFSFSNDVWCFNKDNIKNELENSITPFHKCIHSLEELILNSIISKYSAFSLLQKSDVMNYLYLAYYGKTMPNIYNVENYYDLLIPFQKVLNLNTLQFMNDVLQGMIKSNKESIISCFTEANNLNLVKFLLQKPNSSDLYLKQLFLLRILDAPSITLIMENEKENKFEDSFSLCLNEIDSTLKNYILFKENDKINSKDSNEIRDFWQKNIWQNPQYLNIALDNQNIIEKYLNNQAVLIEDKQLMLYYIISSIMVKLNNSDIILSRSKITTMNSLLTLSVTNPFLIKSKIQKVSHFPDIKPEGLDHTLPEMNTEHDIKLTPGTENHTKFVLEANKTDIKIENDEITTESKTEIKSLSKVDLSLEKVDISIHDLELNDLEFLMNEIGVSQTIQNIIRENDPILSYFILDKEFDESSILIDQFLNTFKGKLITDFLIEAPKLDNRLTFLDHVESFSYGKVLDHFDEWFLQDIDGYPLIVIQLANLIKNVSNFCFVDQIRALNSILEPWLSIDAIQVNNQGYSYISLYFIKCILEGYQRMNQEMKNELNKIDDLLIILNEIVKPILMNEIFSNDAYMFIKDSNDNKIWYTTNYFPNKYHMITRIVAFDQKYIELVNDNYRTKSKKLLHLFLKVLKDYKFLKNATFLLEFIFRLRIAFSRRPAALYVLLNSCSLLKTSKKYPSIFEIPICKKISPKFEFDFENIDITISFEKLCAYKQIFIIVNKFVNNNNQYIHEFHEILTQLMNQNMIQKQNIEILKNIKISEFLPFMSIASFNIEKFFDEKILSLFFNQVNNDKVTPNDLNNEFIKLFSGVDLHFVQIENNPEFDVFGYSKNDWNLIMDNQFEYYHKLFGEIKRNEFDLLEDTENNVESNVELVTGEKKKMKYFMFYLLSIFDSNLYESSDISRQYCDREEEIMLMNLYRISIKPSKPNPKLLNFLSDKIQNML